MADEFVKYEEFEKLSQNFDDLAEKFNDLVSELNAAGIKKEIEFDEYEEKKDYSDMSNEKLNEEDEFNEIEL